MEYAKYFDSVGKNVVHQTIAIDHEFAYLCQAIFRSYEAEQRELCQRFGGAQQLIKDSQRQGFRTPCQYPVNAAHFLKRFFCPNGRHRGSLNSRRTSETSVTRPAALSANPRSSDARS